jgi:hypothetical protein
VNLQKHDDAVLVPVYHLHMVTSQMFVKELCMAKKKSNQSRKTISNVFIGETWSM